MLEFLLVVFLITLAWYFLKDGKKEQSKTPNESSEPPNLKTGDDYLAQKIKVFIFDNWQLKVGSILVFIGLVLLARYAIMHNLIGPMERILLGIVLSCFVSILGQLRLKSNFNQGIVLLTLGAIGGITTTVLGQHLYSLYANWFSALLSLCFLIHLLLMSNKYSSEGLALLASVGCLLVPEITDIAVNKNLFSWYVLLIGLSLIGYAAKKSYQRVEIANLLLMIYYSNTLDSTSEPLFSRFEFYICTVGFLWPAYLSLQRAQLTYENLIYIFLVASLALIQMDVFFWDHNKPSRLLYPLFFGMLAYKQILHNATKLGLTKYLLGWLLLVYALFPLDENVRYVVLTLALIFGSLFIKNYVSPLYLVHWVLFKNLFLFPLYLVLFYKLQEVNKWMDYRIYISCIFALSSFYLYLSFLLKNAEIHGYALAFGCTFILMLMRLIWQVSGYLLPSYDYQVAVPLLVYTVAGLLTYRLVSDRIFIRLGDFLLAFTGLYLIFGYSENLSQEAKIFLYIGVGLMFILTIYIRKSGRSIE